jgi:hypothetical protein
MKTALLVCSVLLGSVATAWSLPQVDGKISSGEYANSLSVIDGNATVYWQPDGKGGVYLAVSAKTHGWVGLGLGSRVMDGASIFMGYLKDGTKVFSEQKGSGHSHSPSTLKRADKNAVAQDGDSTVIEFHVPADKLPFTGKKADFIVAFSGEADLTTFHEDNLDGGSFTLP